MKLTNSYENEKVLDLLGKIYQAEMAGVHRYLHYSFMIMGHNRIPIQKWFRANAQEAMGHATIIGEKITALGGHPPMLSGKVEEENLHSVSQLLEESLRYEMEALNMYKSLAGLAVEVEDIALEELAREFVKGETEHVEEVAKMMKRPD